MHWNRAGAHCRTMPLSRAMTGETVELVRIDGCHRLRRRLADMGLNVGMTVRVIQGGTAGQVILAVRGDSRLAIGRSMAEKILVSVPETLENGKWV